MDQMLRNNGLSIVLLLLFVVFIAGQVVTGMHEYNDERADHGAPPLQAKDYLRTGHFVEITAENWESEFLQMAAYVLLTVRLFQRGSSESKDPARRAPVDRDPRQSAHNPRAPWPVRRGGWVLRIYENSLALAFIGLFAICVVLHAFGGAAAYNEDQLAHAGVRVSVLEYMQTTRFWFESFQNWQSEFLALASMVLLSIVLRQRGSPESKPVDAPHGETGSS